MKRLLLSLIVLLTVSVTTEAFAQVTKRSDSTLSFKSHVNVDIVPICGPIKASPGFPGCNETVLTYDGAKYSCVCNVPPMICTKPNQVLTSIGTGSDKAQDGTKFQCGDKSSMVTCPGGTEAVGINPDGSPNCQQPLQSKTCPNNNDILSSINLVGNATCITPKAVPTCHNHEVLSSDGTDVKCVTTSDTYYYTAAELNVGNNTCLASGANVLIPITYSNTHVNAHVFSTHCQSACDLRCQKRTIDRNNRPMRYAGGILVGWDGARATCECVKGESIQLELDHAGDGSLSLGAGWLSDY